MPKRRTPPRVRRFAWLWAFGLLAAADSSVAQPPAGLTVELVDQRIATLRAAGTPSDSTTLTTYEQARGFLNDAGSYVREAATYVESLTSAPQREAEIQRRLDTQDEAYDPATELTGLTTDELRTRLADGFFKDPQIAVSVESYRSQRIFITGEVRTPGAFPLTGELTLLDAIAKAGFATLDAADEVVVIRSGKGAGPAAAPTPSVTDAKPFVTVSLKALQNGAAIAQNVLLQDGDTVFVGRAEPVFVYGQVKNPGSYPIRTETTVLQALSLAGGATAVGATNRIRIIRVVNGERKEYRATLTDFVQPGDTVMVPQRYF